MWVVRQKAGYSFPGDRQLLAAQSTQDMSSSFISFSSLSLIVLFCREWKPAQGEKQRIPQFYGMRCFRAPFGTAVVQNSAVSESDLTYWAVM